MNREILTKRKIDKLQRPRKKDDSRPDTRGMIIRDDGVSTYQKPRTASRMSRRSPISQKERVVPKPIVRNVRI